MKPEKIVKLIRAKEPCSPSDDMPMAWKLGEAEATQLIRDYAERCRKEAKE